MRRTRFPAPARNPSDDRNRSAGKCCRSLRTDDAKRSSLQNRAGHWAINTLQFRSSERSTLGEQATFVECGWQDSACAPSWSERACVKLTLPRWSVIQRRVMQLSNCPATDATVIRVNTVNGGSLPNTAFFIIVANLALPA